VTPLGHAHLDLELVAVSLGKTPLCIVEDALIAAVFKRPVQCDFWQDNFVNAADRYSLVLILKIES
jgi:hypothetical protein